MTIRADLIEGRRATVFGMARSGLAAARLLLRYGAKVFVSELRPLAEVRAAADALGEVGISFETGGHTGLAVDDRDFIVISPGIPTTAPILQEAQRRHLPMFSEIEIASWVCEATIMAITGSNGKSTTTALTAHIINQSGRKARATGNIGSPFADDVVDLRANDFAVVEVSSFQLENSDTFRPRVAAILNITPDHLDRYGKLENYVETKYRIADSQEESDTIVLNADDQLCSGAQLWGKPRRLLFSNSHQVEQGTFVAEQQLCYELDAARGTICPVTEIGIPGPHNLANAAAAAAMCLTVGIEPESIAAGLKSFTGIEHRLEFVSEVRQIRFVNDSKATNVDSVNFALQSVAAPVILIMGGRDKGGDFASLAELVRQKVKLLILIGEAADLIATALGDEVETVRCVDLPEAVKFGCERGAPGDTVLLSPACASFDQFRDFEERGRVFKRVVEEL